MYNKTIMANTFQIYTAFVIKSYSRLNNLVVWVTLKYCVNLTFFLKGQMIVHYHFCLKVANQYNITFVVS